MIPVFKTVFFFLLSGFLFFDVPAAAGQGISLQQDIDSLNHYGFIMLSRQPYSIRNSAFEKFSKLLRKSLNAEQSFSKNYDSLKTVAVFTTPDRKFRIFNWETQNEEGRPSYFAWIQFADGRIQELSDRSRSLSRTEKSLLEAEKWWGAHYYKLVQKTYKKKTYYILLGANFSDPVKRKKIIEVLSIDRQGEIKFGAPIFENDKQVLNRVIFEYRPDVSMSVRYEEEKERIIFDHLSPPDESLKGQTQYYGPDLSYDAYYWKKGRWKLRENVDARNKIEKK